MKKTFIFYCMAVVLLATSCREQQQEGDASFAVADTGKEMVPMARQSAQAQSAPVDIAEQTEVIKSKIIKDGRLGLKVTELEKAKERVDSLVQIHDGYYANESFQDTDQESVYYIRIRIPGANFETFINEVEAGDVKVLYKAIDARDVTDQFIDLEIRLENKRSYLKRYNELLNQAMTVKDILEIQERVRALEEEIESTTGRLRYLSDLVDYSTLELTITRQKDFTYSPANRDGFFERLKQSVSKGWFGIVDSLLFAIKIWPLWVVLALIITLWKKPSKRKKNN
ncbi:MAG: DUF4349 domain-containing protein [Bacteroidales bacterium]